MISGPMKHPHPLSMHNGGSFIVCTLSHFASIHISEGSRLGPPYEGCSSSLRRTKIWPPELEDIHFFLSRTYKTNINTRSSRNAAIRHPVLKQKLHRCAVKNAVKACHQNAKRNDTLASRLYKTKNHMHSQNETLNIVRSPNDETTI